LVGDVEPTIAEYVPECAVELIEVAAPPRVQPVKSPVSNPPLVMPPPGGGVGVGVGVGGGVGVGVGVGGGVGVGVGDGVGVFDGVAVGVGVLLGVAVGVGVLLGVGVGVGEPPQLANLNEPMRVFQLKLPFDGMYWFVYQNVQSSDGSTVMAL
jgi:hypothetical protein